MIQNAGFVALTDLIDPDNVVVPKGMLEHPMQERGSEGGDGTLGKEGGQEASGGSQVSGRVVGFWSERQKHHVVVRTS